MNYMKGSDDFPFNYTYESTQLKTCIHGLEQGFSCKENTRYSDILHPDILPFRSRYRKPKSASRVLPSGLSKSAVSASTMSAFLDQSQWKFYGGFHDIKYYQFCWYGKKREWCNLMGCEESFITMQLIWHSYLVVKSSVTIHISNGWERLTRVGMNAQVPLSMHDCEIKTFLFMSTFHGCRRVSFSAEVGRVLWKFMNG